MPSLRGRLLQFAMRHRHWFRLRLREEKVDWTSVEAILRFRQQCEDGAKRFGKVPPELDVVPVDAAGIRAEWIRPPEALPGKAIFFVHGGGYVSGSCADHRVHVAKFVKGTRIAAFLYEYRLAPEHVFPAAVDDSLAAYEWLLAQGFRADDVVFAGDSAGGGLCLAVLLALKDRGIPLPAAAVALSPWTDLQCGGRSYMTNAAKCLSPAGCWTAFSKHYAGTTDPAHPYCSPLHGDPSGLPPLLLFAGGDEILLDDAMTFAEKARAAGVDVTLRIGDGLFHCYPVCAPLFPEATQAMDEIGAFIKSHAGREGPVKPSHAVGA